MSINLNIKHNATTITDITSGSIILNTAGKICNDNLSFTLSGTEFWDGTLFDTVFGNGNLGDVQISSSEVWTTNAEDTGVIEKQYKSLIIDSSAIVEAGQRNSGIIIRCQGDCTINGTIQNLLAPKSHDEDLSDYYPAYMITNGTGGDGGAGGTGGGPSYGGSTGMAGRFYGGGYSGGAGGGGTWSSASCYGGAGGSAIDITLAVPTASLFLGGEAQSTYRSHGNAGVYGGGGSGGRWDGTTSGIGGAGGTGPGSYGQDCTAAVCANSGGGAGNYGGGVIIIYCGGNLTISGNIICNGSAGGNGGTAHYTQTSSGNRFATSGGGGGGGGGGRIYLMSAGSLVTTGVFNVSGGPGGQAGEADLCFDGSHLVGANGSDGSDGTKWYQSYSEYIIGAVPHQL